MDQPVAFAPGSGGLDEDEVEAALRVLEDGTPTEDGKVGRGALAPDVRRSRIRWIVHSADTAWLFSRMFSLAHVANTTAGWDFDVVGPYEKLQVSRYDEGDRGTYDWHMDLGSSRTSSRKITVVVELEPAREGGALQFRPGPGPYSMPIEAGTAVVFPSYLAHRITPVTQGRRTSLVAWVCGPPFR